MDKEPVRQSNHMPRGAVLRRIGLGVLVLFLIGAIPASAWLSHQRRLTAAQKVENPVAIYIGAGQKEDMRYIDINNIDVLSDEVKTEGDARYQDFVFSVYGDLYTSYRLQLAFTTNNPFTYVLYPAELSTSGSDEVRVKYTPHGEDTTPIYYTIKKDNNDVPVGAINGTYRNKASTAGNPPMAVQPTSDPYYKKTYDTDNTAYQYVDSHAKPVYWQSNEINNYELVDNKTFEHYYILRVMWPAEFTINTKETDILCIAALGHQE